jgi:NADH-quinone oxidoreductase subunit D
MTDTRNDTESVETETVDVWLSGTEEPPPPFDPTDEGRQEFVPEESEFRLAEQLGRVVSDDYLYEEIEGEDERMVVNMGPQHPSTHGVLRLQIELEGEVIRRTRPIVGYLHTGMEKTAETLTFLQGPTNVTRMDYLAPFHNELAYSLAVERCSTSRCRPGPRRSG